MAFDHYVSQAFMKFWSTPNHRGDLDRRVWCFDFETKTLEEFHTRNLFGVEGLNSEDTESRLGRIIEDKLARFVPLVGQHADGAASEPSGRVVQLDDEDTLRAISIAFHVQIARGSDGAQRGNDDAARILSGSDAELHQLGDRFRERHRIGTFTLPAEHALCLPEKGWFWFPILDPERGALWAFAIPLKPSLALVAIPRGVELAPERENDHLAIFSIGAADIRRVVIPFEPKRTDDHSKIVQGLLTYREKVMEMSPGVERIRATFAAERARAGLPPLNTMAGDFR